MSIPIRVAFRFAAIPSPDRRAASPHPPNYRQGKAVIPRPIDEFAHRDVVAVGVERGQVLVAMDVAVQSVSITSSVSQGPECRGDDRQLELPVRGFRS
jgi:hypothetical protein